MLDVLATVLDASQGGQLGRCLAPGSLTRGELLRPGTANLESGTLLSRAARQLLVANIAHCATFTMG
jgi:hypothetical protein